MFNKNKHFAILSFARYETKLGESRFSNYNEAEGVAKRIMYMDSDVIECLIVKIEGKMYRKHDVVSVRLGEKNVD